MLFVLNILNVNHLLKRTTRETTSTNIYLQCKVRVLVFSSTFNNISAISWVSVLLVEETGVPRENHRPVASHFVT